MSKIQGVIEIFPQYMLALKDLEGFTHLFCLYSFDIVKLPVPLQFKPFLSNELKGVFAIRTPFRPNPIGLSILKILEIKENVIKLANIDILDIKPYIPHFDCVKTKKNGWLEGHIRKKES